MKPLPVTILIADILPQTEGGRSRDLAPTQFTI
ncbi:hypothetical protein DFR49_1222 [Hephaestia caeni]|uniref:Uncharacterized protein n=1 Tax=Hephaestia caeni TaxID=645617 RepID=A0A397PKM5_9SPHN|nr:hypothetical protein DFR49_1222 [Hephaestia caeni]